MCECVFECCATELLNECEGNPEKYRNEPHCFSRVYSQDSAIRTAVVACEVDTGGLNF